MAEDTSSGNSMKQKLAAGELVLCMNLRLAPHGRHRHGRQGGRL
jgi:hypothetical protein